MKVVADLELHSKYARAVSSSMNVPTIAGWATKKGIDLVGTGDFTHPMWFRELQTNLEEVEQGIYKLKPQVNINNSEVKFLLTSEVSCIYSHKGKGRRVHLLIYLPGFSDVEKLNKELSLLGANLFSDGRPIIGLSLAQVAETALNVNKKALLIPAHVWTPWFGFYGNMSGYDSLFEAFGELERYIPAVETGLSSDPAMNWRIAELTDKRIVSFGDAHSPQKLGREATVFDVEKLTYDAVGRAIWGKKPDKIAYTIEFYPEEGKYHYTGHRKCGVVYSPNETRKMGLTCPVCSRPLTKGVMSRVEELAASDLLNNKLKITKDKFGVQWVDDDKSNHPPYVMLVPLLEIISEVLSSGVGSIKVNEVYELLISNFRSEFTLLLETSLKDITKVAGVRVAEAISKVRGGDIVIKPGYDGVFGTVRIWRESEDSEKDRTLNQTSLF